MIVVQLKSDCLLSNVDELVEVQSHYLSLYSKDDALKIYLNVSFLTYISSSLQLSAVFQLALK